MNDRFEVIVTMPAYVADFIAEALEAKAATFPKDDGYLDLADMLRHGGQDAEVSVRRREASNE